MSSTRRRSWGGLIYLAACLLVGCAARVQLSPTPAVEVFPPAQSLPSAGAVLGWPKTNEDRTYDRDTLYSFMDGAADLYFTYGFESLAVGDYGRADGSKLRVEIYRTATDADAYGLYTYNAFGDPLDLGMEGRWESGAALFFWQHRTFVQIVTRGQVDDASLRAFGQAVASALPEGGARPALVDALPVDGLQPGSVRFFREQMALDNFLWLGSEDVLGLGSDVEGVLAEYKIDDQHAVLVVIAFPDAARAQQALSGIERAGVEDLEIAKVRGSTLGAVFGQPGADTAAALLEQALAMVS
jgi:hypothetical protein